MTSKEAWETIESWLGEYSFINEQKIIKKDLDRLEKLKQLMKVNYFPVDDHAFIDLTFNYEAAKEIKEWLENDK